MPRANSTNQIFISDWFGWFLGPVSHFFARWEAHGFLWQRHAKAYISIGFHTFFRNLRGISPTGSFLQRSYHFFQPIATTCAGSATAMWFKKALLCNAAGRVKCSSDHGGHPAQPRKKGGPFICFWRKDPSKHPPKMSLSSTYTFIHIKYTRTCRFIDGSYFDSPPPRRSRAQIKVYERIRFEVPQNCGNRNSTTTPTQPFDSNRSPEKDHHPTKHSLGGKTFKRSPIFYLIHRKSTANQRDVCLCVCQKLSHPPSFTGRDSL